MRERPDSVRIQAKPSPRLQGIETSLPGRSGTMWRGLTLQEYRMTNEHRSDYPNRGWNRIPECYRAIDTWPSADESLLKGQKNRSRYRRLCTGIQLYLERRPLADVQAATGLSKRRFLAIVERCLQAAPDGRIWGLRACVDGARVNTLQRCKALTEHDNDHAGYQGMFRKFLRDHPEIETRLIKELSRKGVKSAGPKRLAFRGAHRAFLRICKEAGIAENAYPLKQQSKAVWGLRKWMREALIPHEGAAWVAHEYGEDAAKKYAFQSGDGQAKRLPLPYEAWELDEVTIDVEGVYEIPNAAGDWEEVALRRAFALRVIDVAAGAKLANRLVLAPQASAEDVAMLLWDAVSGVVLSEEVRNTGLLPGAGFPAAEIPELRFAVPQTVYLDNALAHLSDHVQHLISSLWGAKAKLGRPGTPLERPHIEADFAVQARQFLHQVPGTTGSGPGDPLRDKGGRRVSVTLLAAAIDCYCANANVSPAAASHYIAPLERLRRSLASRALAPTYLPAHLRRPHFFNKPVPVPVHADLRSGRCPYINYMYQRYSSNQLRRCIGLTGKRMWVRPDFGDMRTVLLFDDAGSEFGPVHVQGAWGRFPHDIRIRKLYGRLKRERQLGQHPEDAPLECLLNALRKRAPGDRNAALQLAYLEQYLLAHGVGVSPLGLMVPDTLPIAEVAEGSTRGTSHMRPVRADAPTGSEPGADASPIFSANRVPRVVVRR